MTNDISHTGYLESNFSLENVNLSNSGNASIPLDILMPYIDSSVRDYIEELKKNIIKLSQRDELTQKMFYEQGIEKQKLKEENKDLRRENQELKSQNDNAVITYDFNPAHDARKFKNSTEDWNINLWRGMYDLANYKENNGDYLIQYKYYIYIIYFVMVDKTFPYPFVGTRGDFVYFWNANVANRFVNANRKKQLTIQEGSLNVEVKKDIWTVSPSSWEKLSKMDNENASYYEIGNKIKNKVMSIAQHNL